MPPDNVVVVTLSGGAVTEILRFADCVVGVGVCESVTEIVKLDVPVKVPVGEPEITPVFAFRLSPAGRPPVVTDQ